jgi:hypothetical protein
MTSDLFPCRRHRIFIECFQRNIQLARPDHSAITATTSSVINDLTEGALFTEDHRGNLKSMRLKPKAFESAFPQRSSASSTVNAFKTFSHRRGRRVPQRKNLTSFADGVSNSPDHPEDDHGFPVKHRWWSSLPFSSGRPLPFHVYFAAVTLFRMVSASGERVRYRASD